jgi:hypothetical protein
MMIRNQQLLDVQHDSLERKVKYKINKFFVIKIKTKEFLDSFVFD